MDHPITQAIVSDSNMFWFHCGRCGSLFQAQSGEALGRLCPHCGADPSLGIGILESMSQAATVHELGAPDFSPPAERLRQRGRKSGKTHNAKWLILRIVGGWLLVLAVIVLVARLLWPPDPFQRKPAVPLVSMNEDSLLLNEALPSCIGAFSGFLSAGTPEARNQYVLAPVSTALRMARFYDLNSLADIDTNTISLTARAVFNVPGGKAIETHWMTPNGKTLDAVFRQEHDEWRLDWEDFARYSDCPWSLFLSGNGDSDAEFRLLARERLAEERKDSETISVVLYAPRFGHPQDVGYQSPEFLISRNSRSGKLLDAAFQLTRDGKRVFNAQLADLNPEGMIRVRVKIRRSNENTERTFEVLEVLACHWYSVDDPGVEPAVSDGAGAQD